MLNTHIRPLSTLRPNVWEKTVPALEHSATAMHAVKLCTRLALSEHVKGRDAYLDRIEAMSEDELAEHAYACEALS